jgi:hypothetical protein
MDSSSGRARQIYNYQSCVERVTWGPENSLPNDIGILEKESGRGVKDTSEGGRMLNKIMRASRKVKHESSRKMNSLATALTWNNAEIDHNQQQESKGLLNVELSAPVNVVSTSTRGRGLHQSWGPTASISV